MTVVLFTLLLMAWIIAFTLQNQFGQSAIKTSFQGVLFKQYRFLHSCYLSFALNSPLTSEHFLVSLKVFIAQSLQRLFRLLSRLSIFIQLHQFLQNADTKHSPTVYHSKTSGFFFQIWDLFIQIKFDFARSEYENTKCIVTNKNV